MGTGTWTFSGTDSPMMNGVVGQYGTLGLQQGAVVLAGSAAGPLNFATVYIDSGARP